jgi:hypothetical protein
MTNHLESFNSQIKHHYFGAYQHSGQLPHIDVWIVILITKVIPAFFPRTQSQRSQSRVHPRHATRAIMQPQLVNYD